MKKLFLVMLCTYTLFSSEIATVKLIDGDVVAIADGKKQTLKAGSKLDEYDVVQTSAKSSITIIFNDSSVLVLGENSIMNLKRYLFKPKEGNYDFQLFLKQGSASFESGDIGKISPKDFIFETPQGTVAIRGTKFAVKLD